MMNYLEVLRVANGYSNDHASKLLVLSNCTTNKHTNVLKWFFWNSKLKISVNGGSFDSLVSDSFDLVGSTAQVLIHYDILSYFHGRAINYMTCEDKVIEEVCDNIIKELDLVLNNLSLSRDIFFVPFHVFGLSRVHRSSLNLSDSLNEFVNKCCESMPNLRVLNPVIDKHDWLVKDFIRSKAPHSLALIRRICSEVNVRNLKNEGRVKKVIVFDCDNTLWKGVIGESIDGSHVKYAHDDSIGFYFHNIHLLINSLSRYGILVGLITKNNLSDLELFFQKNSLVLDLNNIVSIKSNWRDKHLNLIEMATDLNLGVESFCFVDDSSFEIEMMSSFLPQVACFQVPNELENYFEELLTFIRENFSLSVDLLAGDRIATYKSNLSRKNLEMTSSSRDEFIRNLAIRVTHKVNDRENLARIEELFLKTNQFNLVTERLTISDILDCMAYGDEFHTFNISDKFGNFGTTALIHCRFEKNEVHLRNFIMSCRVMGRNIELDLVSIIENYYVNTYKALKSRYVLSPKNSSVRNLYDVCGFDLNFEDESVKDYSKELVSVRNLNFILYESDKK